MSGRVLGRAQRPPGRRRRIWVVGLVSVLLAGCQAGVAPEAPTPTLRVLATATSLPAASPTTPPATPTSLPATATPPPAAAQAPTARPSPTAAATAVPTLDAALVPTPPPRGVPIAPPEQPPPAADPTRAAQQQYCDQASPPAHLPLPISARQIVVPVPNVLSQPAPAGVGPRQEGTDAPPSVTAEHVVIVDDESGALLYQRDPFARVAPASITKIATTIVALEHEPDISSVFTTTVSASALVACDGSSVMGLEPGDHVRLETLLYGMMLPSGNDAAEQVAVSLAGARGRFVDWMNEKVASLGLRDTHFVTPSGMDADNHYSSAYDMAMIGRYAMRNPTFRTIAATPRFVGDDYYMHNLNSLIGVYPGADGVKIGYTDIAGRTIVASATRAGHRVYVALMHSKDLHGDSTKLFDWVWANFRWG